MMRIIQVSMAGPGARGCVASWWPDEFGEDRFFEFGEDRSLCRGGTFSAHFWREERSTWQWREAVWLV